MTEQLRAAAIDQLLQRLGDALQHYAVAERRLAAEWRRRREDAEAAATEAMAELQTRQGKERQDAATDFAARRARVRENHQRYVAWRERAAARLQKRIVDTTTHAEQSVRNAYQQVVWRTGSEYKTVLAAAEQDRAAAETRLEDLDATLERTAAKVAAWRRRFGVTSEDASVPSEFGAVDIADLAGRARDLAARTEIIGRPMSLRLFALVRSKVLLWLAVLAHAAVGALAWQAHVPWRPAAVGLGTSLAAVLAALWIWHGLTRRRLRRGLLPLIGELEIAQAACAAARQQTTDECEERCGAAAAKRDAEVAEAAALQKEITDEARERRRVGTESARHKSARLAARIEADFAAATQTLETHYEPLLAAVEDSHPAAIAALQETQRQEAEVLDAAEARAWAELEAGWRDESAAIWRSVCRINEIGAATFPQWDDACWSEWLPGEDFPLAIPFGFRQVELAALSAARPTPVRLPFPGEEQFPVPATLSFPGDCSLLLESRGEGRDAALRVLENVMLRLLTSFPGGKINFTIIDPIGLGQNFAGFMHLADFDESFVGRRIWTEARMIEQQLADIGEHMEKVIQKYLRNEFATIADFNASAGELAEGCRFLVISDFPANFSEVALQRLAGIVNSGARCGVYTLIHRDQRLPLPGSFDLKKLRHSGVCLAYDGDAFRWRNAAYPELTLVTEEPPGREQFTAILRRVGEQAKDAARVEVPMVQVAPPSGGLWTRDSAEELRIPIGKAGATKVQELALGRGTAQHGLIAGKTGSGKSTLFHVLITSTALYYSPDQVELYLVDFKKGVEFKCYASGRLPHLRAVAIESDREFGLSILRRVDQELKRRGTAFRERGVQDLRGYRAAAVGEVMPRTLVIIDEFHELFVEDDRIAQEAALLLDRIVRQGRAFGIHMLLGSQTLGGSYALARTTMGQMTVRIALQCSEADSYLILSDDNAAARLLSRPGEAIYNDASGMLEGNSPFQVVWLPDAARDGFLRQVEAQAQAAAIVVEPPIVFEGNAPARISANTALTKLAVTPGSVADGAVRIWLGEPNTIKGPTHAVLEAHAGNHLLIVGQQSETALAILSAALAAVAGQHPWEKVRLVLLDGSRPDSADAEFLDDLVAAFDGHLERVGYREVPERITALGNELGQRQADDRVPDRVYLVAFGLHRFRHLRHQEDYSFGMGGEERQHRPDEHFASLIADGPEAGYHVLAWCDSVSNLNRTLSRRSQNEFGFRILFQMGSADSAVLIDSPAAGRLGLHTALFYDEQAGVLEKFRPYALPEANWLRSFVARLRHDTKDEQPAEQTL